MTSRHFSPALFAFLRELKANNDRAWFAANKARYVEAVQEPALEFVVDFGPVLHEISPRLVAGPRSLFRIHRDTRFSRDKTPYKTHTGIQFRHEAARDVHAPGFYLHLEPGNVMVAAGIWRPAPPALASIRAAIDREPDEWLAAAAIPGFALNGESLKRPPAGFDPGHPLVADLKRKDFIAVSRLPERTVTRPGFLDEFADRCRAASPFMAFLCRALGVPFR